MNYHQFKQQLLNNLWRGENSRENNRIHHLKGLDTLEIALTNALVMPDVTRVWGIDISHWNIPPVDLQRMIDLYHLDFVIFKGYDGTVKAKYCDDHKATAKATGKPWGIYDWLYKNSNVSIDAQTTAWANQANADPPPMGVFIDAEWTNYGGQAANPTASDLRMAHDKLRAKSKPATTYTAAGYADQYLRGFDWSREELWVAHYGVQVPQLPQGAHSYNIWQFTASLDGKQLDPSPQSNKELDGNYYNGSHEQFTARYGGATPEPPPDDVITQPHSGMTRVSGMRYGWEFELFKLVRNKFRFEVVYCNPPETVSSVVKRKGATGGFNAGDYNRFTYEIQDYTVSNGTQIKAREQGAGRPSLMISNDNTIVIDTQNAANIQQAFTGIRPLVNQGVIDPRLFDTSQSQNTEGHARFVFSLDANGDVILMASRGIHPSVTVFDGLTLSEAAHVAQEHGAITAADGGGGGDVTCILDGESLIEPENIDPATGLRFERALPVVFVFYAKDVIMTTNGLAQENLNKIPTFRSSPTVASGNDVKKGYAGMVVEFTGEPLPDLNPAASLKWLHAIDGTYFNLSDATHSGANAYFIITQQPSTTPPPDPDAKSPVSKLLIDQDFQTKSLTITRLRLDGTSDVTHDLIA